MLKKINDKGTETDSLFTFLGTEFVHSDFGPVYPVYRHLCKYFHDISVIQWDKNRSNSLYWRKYHIMNLVTLAIFMNS